jgi:hypothetical protein
VSDPKEILERRLDKVAELQDTCGLHFFCQIGSNDDVRGLTTLQVAGSGGTLLSWRGGDDNKLFSVQLSQSDLVKLYKILRANPFWDASPARRPGRDGEVNIHVRLADQAAGTHGSMQFWDGDIDEFPVLGRLMQPLINLMRLIAQDEIPHLSNQRWAS